MYTKVVLQVDSEKELDTILDAAYAAKLSVWVVMDEGKTEFKGVKTRTCLAIGPNWNDEIDPITRHLKTY